MKPTPHETAIAESAGVAALNLPELYQCVHCGLCLNQCPTYRALQLEAESPRGRIHLVKAAADGRVELNRRFADHLHLCLLCRACESACPSGVQYGRIAEAAREQLGPAGSETAKTIQNFVFKQVLPYPRRVRFAFALLRIYQLSGLRRLARIFLARRLREMEGLLPEIPRRFFRPHDGVAPALGAKRATVAMLDGCVMPILFGDVNEATVRVLRRSGCDVIFPRRQNCCGALNVHNGETAAARQMARRNIDAFAAVSADAIIVNAAGCGATLKEYGHLLRDDAAYRERAERFSAKVRDAAEFLAELGLTGGLRPMNLMVTYQDPCHLAHGQKVRAQPRQVLQEIPGLTLVEMAGADHCCGSAGIYNLTHPGMSQHLLKEKMQAIAATRAEAVVAPNPGCMLQLRAGASGSNPSLRVYHLIDLLDRAYGTE
jgi:glycolate oxidase iron-sulfur subunit